MTLALNTNKRVYNSAQPPSKKLNIDATPSFIHFLSNYHQNVSIEFLIAISSLNKKISHLVKTIFAVNAKKVGLVLKKSDSVKRKWSQLYTFMNNKSLENGEVTSSACVAYYTNLTPHQIFTILTKSELYTKPDNPVLDVLEAKISKESAQNLKHIILNGSQSESYLALIAALRHGKNSLVKLLLDKCVSLQGKSAYRNPHCQYIPSPLNASILSGNTETVTIVRNHLNTLVDRDVLPLATQEPDDESLYLTPLECAIASSNSTRFVPHAKLNSEMLQFLLSQGVTPEACDLIGAAEIASMNTMNLLIQYGALLDADSASQALNNLVVYSELYCANGISDEQKSMFFFLLQHGADINHISPSTEQTALHAAIYLSHMEWVQLILSQEPNLEQRDLQGNTPLLYAVALGNLDIVQCLLENRANVNALREDNYLSPLSYTCIKDDRLVAGNENNNPHLVALLLKYGANPFPENQPEECRPLFLARQNEFTEIEEILSC